MPNGIARLGLCEQTDDGSGQPEYKKNINMFGCTQKIKRGCVQFGERFVCNHPANILC